MSWFREQLLYKYNSAYSISHQNPANPPIFPLATLLCMAYGMDKLRCRSIRHANFSLVSPTEPNATRPPIISAFTVTRQANIACHCHCHCRQFVVDKRPHTHTHPHSQITVGPKSNWPHLSLVHVHAQLYACVVYSRRRATFNPFNCAQ